MPYGSDNKLPARWGGKQLATLGQAAQEGKAVNTYFEKKHNWIADVSTLLSAGTFAAVT